VDDLIEGFVRLMNSPDDLAGPVNLGNPGEFSMIELAKTILDLTGSRSPPCLRAPAAGRPQTAPAGY
jgi:UDP-glucuronate decarboxylase